MLGSQDKRLNKMERQTFAKAQELIKVLELESKRVSAMYKNKLPLYDFSIEKKEVKEVMKLAQKSKLPLTYVVAFRKQGCEAGTFAEVNRRCDVLGKPVSRWFIQYLTSEDKYELVQDDVQE